MSAFKALFAGAAGAAGYSAYQTYEVGDIQKGIWTVLTKQGNPNQAEVDRLKDQIDNLQKWLLRAQERQAVTIVHANQGSKLNLVMYGAVIGGCAYVYMRWKGLRVSDLMYVTRSSLSAMKQSMADSMAKVQEQLKVAQDELQRRLQRVGAAQAEMREAQAATDSKVESVATDVRDVAGRVGEVHDDVHRLHDGLDRATLGIEAANRSIYLLCGAVVEVAKKVGLQGQHTLALDNMVTHGALPQAAPQGALPLQAPQRPMLQGLQTVIEDMGDGSSGVAGSSSGAASSSGAPAPSRSGSFLSGWLPAMPARTASARVMEAPDKAAADAMAAATGRPRASSDAQARSPPVYDFNSALKSVGSTPAPA